MKRLDICIVLLALIFLTGCETMTNMAHSVKKSLEDTSILSTLDGKEKIYNLSTTDKHIAEKGLQEKSFLEEAGNHTVTVTRTNLPDLKFNVLTGAMYRYRIELNCRDINLKLIVEDDAIEGNSTICIDKDTPIHPIWRRIDK